MDLGLTHAKCSKFVGFFFIFIFWLPFKTFYFYHFMCMGIVPACSSGSLELELDPGVS